MRHEICDVEFRLLYDLFAPLLVISASKDSITYNSRGVSTIWLQLELVIGRRHKPCLGVILCRCDSLIFAW